VNEPREKFPDEMPEDIFYEYTMDDYLEDIYAEEDDFDQREVDDDVDF
jgi:hypothetical protein